MTAGILNFVITAGILTQSRDMTSSLMCTHKNWPELKIVSDKILMLIELKRKNKNHNFPRKIRDFWQF